MVPAQRRNKSKKKKKQKTPKFVFCRRPPHGLQFSGLSSLGQPILTP